MYDEVYGVTSSSTRFFINNLHVGYQTILRTYTAKGKFRKELVNLKTFFNSKQSRIKKLVPFRCIQNQLKLFAMLVSSVSCFFGLMLARIRGKNSELRCLLVSVPYVWH